MKDLIVDRCFEENEEDEKRSYPSKFLVVEESERIEPIVIAIFYRKLRLFFLFVAKPRFISKNKIIFPLKIRLQNKTVGKHRYERISTR